MRIYSNVFDKNVTINAGKIQEIKFATDTDGNSGDKKYKVDIKCSKENFNGLFSLGMSDFPFQ